MPISFESFIHLETKLFTAMKLGQTVPHKAAGSGIVASSSAVTGCPHPFTKTLYFSMNPRLGNLVSHMKTMRLKLIKQQTDWK